MECTRHALLTSVAANSIVQELIPLFQENIHNCHGRSRWVFSLGPTAAAYLSFSISPPQPSGQPLCGKTDIWREIMWQGSEVFCPYAKQASVSKVWDVSLKRDDPLHGDINDCVRWRREELGIQRRKRGGGRLGAAVSHVPNLLPDDMS